MIREVEIFTGEEAACKIPLPQDRGGSRHRVAHAGKTRMFKNLPAESRISSSAIQVRRFRIEDPAVEKRVTMKRFLGKIASPRCGVCLAVFLGITLTAPALPAETADREAQAWRDVVRVLDPARGSSRITDLWRLIKERPPGLGKVLAYVAEHEPDPSIQSQTILGLAKLKESASESMLRRIKAKLGDPNPAAPDDDPVDFSRIHTLVALYRITGEPGLRDQLLSFLGSPRISQASAAVRALSLLRETEVREALYATITKGDYVLACQAADDLLDEQNTPEMRRRLRTAIAARPVVEIVKGQPVREVCLDGVLARLRR